MKHSRQQFRQTHLLYKIRVILSAALFVTAGCSLKKEEEITLGEWIVLINEEAGIIPSQESIPYYFNIDAGDPYFQDVQTAVDFGILSTQYPFRSEEILTREWAAYTLVNLSGSDLSESHSIKDRSSSRFPKEIETAINTGLMTLDSREQFHPKKTISKQDALDLLQKVIQYINHPQMEDIEEIILDDTEDLVQIFPISFEKNTKKVQFQSDQSLDVGSMIYWITDDGEEQVFEITSINRADDVYEASVTEADPLRYAQEIHLEGESELDFSQVEILDEDAVSSSNSPFLNSMSAKFKQTKKINGYTVSYSVTASGIRAEISKELDHGEKLYAKFQLNGVKVKYKWYSKKDDIQQAYFQVDAVTQESLGVSKSDYQKLYGDFSALNAQDFMESITQFLKKKSESSEIEIPICTLQIPVSGSGTLSLKTQLSVVLYATGEAKLALTQTHSMGMEIRNGQARVIHEFDHDQDCSIRAETGMTGNTTFSLNFVNQNLMDLSLNAGAKAKVSTIVHLFDEEGNQQQTEIDYPIDVVEQLSQGNNHVFICGDLAANWVLKLKLNSSKSLMGKLGFGKTMDILNESNAPLWNGSTQHIENWKAVPSCTYHTRKSKNVNQELNVTERIRLHSYSLIVHSGAAKQIVITGLPSGYSESDLVFTSQDESIAVVRDDGSVQGISQGSTKVVIQTADFMHEVVCSILVTK